MTCINVEITKKSNVGASLLQKEQTSSASECFIMSTIYHHDISFAEQEASKTMNIEAQHQKAAIDHHHSVFCVFRKFVRINHFGHCQINICIKRVFRKYV